MCIGREYVKRRLLYYMSVSLYTTSLYLKTYITSCISKTYVTCSIAMYVYVCYTLLSSMRGPYLIITWWEEENHAFSIIPKWMGRLYYYDCATYTYYGRKKEEPKVSIRK